MEGTFGHRLPFPVVHFDVGLPVAGGIDAAGGVEYAGLVQDGLLVDSFVGDGVVEGGVPAFAVVVGLTVEGWVDVEYVRFGRCLSVAQLVARGAVGVVLLGG